MGRHAATFRRLHLLNRTRGRQAEVPHTGDCCHMLCNVAHTRVDTLLNLRMMHIHVLGPEKGRSGIHEEPQAFTGQKRGTQKPEMESHRDDEALSLSEE